MKFVQWVKIKDGKFSFSPYGRALLNKFVGRYQSDEFKLTIEPKKKPKSEKALGFYFAGVLPALIAHDKGLVHQGQIKNNPLILQDLIRSRQITASEIAVKHRDIMVTFRPEISIDLKTGEKCRSGQLLREQDSEYLCELITEVIEYFETQGYEFGDSQEFRLARGWWYNQKDCTKLTASAVFLVAL